MDCWIERVRQEHMEKERDNERMIENGRYRQTDREKKRERKNRERKREEGKVGSERGPFKFHLHDEIERLQNSKNLNEKEKQREKRNDANGKKLKDVMFCKKSIHE